MRPPVYTITEIAKLLKDRTQNHYDGNVIVSGGTGEGKSTIIFKIFKKFPNFKLQDKLVYDRGEMLHLIKDFKKSYIFADELISSFFKRTFWDRLQGELIQALNMYRSNFNIFCGAVPIFYSLDKELLKCFALHIQIIKRGIAIIHAPISARNFSDDPWDVKHNQRLEDEWSKRRQKNPNFKPPIWKYSTFQGYVFFSSLTKKQEEIYEKLKEEKRRLADPNIIKEETKDNFYDKILDMIKNGQMNEQGLLQICLFNNKKLSSVKVRLNQKLKDSGSEKTLGDILKPKGDLSLSNQEINLINKIN